MLAEPLKHIMSGQPETSREIGRLDIGLHCGSIQHEASAQVIRIKVRLAFARVPNAFARKRDANRMQPAHGLGMAMATGDRRVAASMVQQAGSAVS